MSSLDFDGALHRPRPTAPSEHLFRRLYLIEACRRERPGVEAVISCSWRETHPLDELVSYFDGDCRESARRYANHLERRLGAVRRRAATASLQSGEL